MPSPGAAVEIVHERIGAGRAGGGDKHGLQVAGGLPGRVAEISPLGSRTGSSMSAKLWWQIVAAVAIGVLVGIGLAVGIARAAPVLLMFVIGLAIAQLLDPFLIALQRRGFTRLQALWFITFVGAIVLALALTILLPMLVNQVQSAAKAWPAYNQRAIALYERLTRALLRHVEEAELRQQYRDFLDAQVMAAQNWLSEKLPALVAWVSNQVVRSVGWVIVALLLGVIAFHFAMVVHEFRAGLEQVLPPSAAPHLRVIGSQISQMLGQYLRGLATTAVVVGVFSALALGLVSIAFGTGYWLLIGFVAGALYVIPWVGGAVADVLAAFFGYTTAAHHPGWAALANLAAVVIVNQVADTIIMPRIVGRRVGLHPLAVLFGMLCGYQLFGVLGVMLATPAMVCIKIVLAHWLPVRGPAPAERAPREPLDIDLAASLQRAYEIAQRWSGKVEEAMKRKLHGEMAEGADGGQDSERSFSSAEESDGDRG